MGCCVSKKRSEPLGEEARPGPRKKVDARDLPPPEEEKVKEVLSETPSVRPRPRPKRVAGAVAQPSLEKAQAKDGGAARVKQVDGGRVARRAAHSVEEKSEAASESSVATTATGPERSPSSKPPRRRQGPVSGPGEPRRARRDRAAAFPGGVGRHAGRASPSPPPPPRRDPSRRSPSPAAKRSHSQDNRRDATASCPQRKPPVPSRPCGRASTPAQRAQEAPPQPPAAAGSVQPDGGPTHSASPPTPQAPLQEDPAASGGEGEGKESLENPLVSMECFIFL